MTVARIATLFCGGFFITLALAAPQEWTGAYHCSPIPFNPEKRPGYTNKVVLVVDESQAKLTRERIGPKPAQEILTGTVSPDGRLVLESAPIKGEGFGPPLQLRFEGRFSGNQFEATGAVRAPDGKKLRDCTLTVARSAIVADSAPQRAKPAAEIEPASASRDSARAASGISRTSVAIIAAVLLVLGTVFVVFRKSAAKGVASTGAENQESSTVADALRQVGFPLMREPHKKAVFISYRRSDSIDITGRIYDRLTQKFGRNRIFKDVDSIPIGIDFRAHLQHAVAQSGVFLAIIGKEWAGELGPGTRRLDDEGDHLRIEVETALERKIPVVPVLVRGAIVPTEQELPSSLQALAYRNGVVVRPDPDFHADVDRLIRGIETHLK